MNHRRLNSIVACGAVALAAIAFFALPASELSFARERVLAENTFWLFLQVSLLATPVGLLVALTWLKTDLPVRRPMLIVLVVLMFLPLYVQASAWQAGFGQLGWYTVGGQTIASPVLSGWRASVWVHVANAVPWAALIIGIGLATVPRDTEEAAILDASPWQVSGLITIPQIGPWIIVAGIWIGISAAQEMVVVDLFQIDTYARYLYTAFAQEVSAEGTLRIVLAPSIAAVMLMGAALWIASSRAPAGLSELYVAPLRHRMGTARWTALFLLLSLVALLTAVPLGNLLYQAGYEVASDNSYRWSFAAVLRVMQNGWREFHDEIQWSFLISALAASLSLCAALLGTAIARSHRWLAPWPWLLAAFLVSVPAPLVGLWLIPVLNRPEWLWLSRLHNETVFSPVLAAALRSWPILFILCWFAARDIPRDVLELASLEGAGRLRRFLSVGVPLLWRGWMLSWLVGFGLASGELAATLMVLPPGAATVATRVYGLIHSGVREKEAALCLWHAALCAFLAVIALRLYDRQAKVLRTPAAMARL